MKFDKNYFINQTFTEESFEKYKISITKNLPIARNNSEPDIRFHFSYMAMLKIGIYLIAKNRYRVKSRPGHHQIIIETMSQLIGDNDILIVGDKMRKDRNLDLYGAELPMSAKDADEYLQFVEDLSKKIGLIWHTHRIQAFIKKALGIPYLKFYQEEHKNNTVQKNHIPSKKAF